MHLHWFSLTLLSAFSLATSDALGKKFMQGYTAAELVIVRFVGAAVLLAPLLWERDFPTLPIAFWAWLGISIPLEILAMLLYMQAVRDGELSLSLPYLSFTPVFTVLLGEVVLGEKVSAAALLGIFLVVLGTFLLHAEKHGTLWCRFAAPYRTLRHSRGVRSMLIVALIYSVTVITTKAALQYMPGGLFGPFYFAVLGVVTLVLAGVLRPSSLQVLMQRPSLHLLVAGLFATMVYTHFVAIERVQAAYMVAVKRSSILFSVIYGSVLFAEPAFRKRLAAASLMIAGVALIGLQGGAA
jgi:drug/metabolite transporter (DMT)-like permease